MKRVINFFKRLLDNSDPTINSKLFLACFAMVLVVLVVVCLLVGVTTQIEILIALLGFICSLMGINQIPTKINQLKEPEYEKYDDTREDL